MKIYTKTGDEGTTGLLGGIRVSKAHYRVEAYGTVDELNAHLGLVGDQSVNAGRKEFIRAIQDRLFSIGAHLASSSDQLKKPLPDLKAEDINTLEKAIDEMEESLPEMKNFIIPGGDPAVSYCHIARCVCRRAERWVIHLHQKEPVNLVIIQYLNRLSDYLFVLSRKMAHELQIDEIPWRPRKK